MSRSVLQIATGAAKGRQTRDEEHAEQVLLFRRLALDPRTRDALIYAVPNFPGHVGTLAARIRAGARAKAEGRKKGCPDVNVDEARGRFHGLRIEMKSAAGTLSPEQREWHAKLTARGYAVLVCRSATAAFDQIVGYLALAPVRPEHDRPGSSGSAPQQRS